MEPGNSAMVTETWVDERPCWAGAKAAAEAIKEATIVYFIMVVVWLTVPLIGVCCWPILSRDTHNVRGYLSTSHFNLNSRRLGVGCGIEGLCHCKPQYEVEMMESSYVVLVPEPR